MELEGDYFYSTSAFGVDHSRCQNYEQIYIYKCIVLLMEKSFSFLIKYISELSYFYFSEGVESVHLLLHKCLYFYASTECKYFCHMCAPHHPALTKSPVLSQWKPHLSVRPSVCPSACKGLVGLCNTFFSRLHQREI